MMKKMSQELLADIVKTRRNQKNMTQEALGLKTDINRVMIGKIENGTYVPSIAQLEMLSQVLGFDISEVFVERKPMYYSAFRGTANTDKDQKGIECLLKMMMVSKQQLLLREMLEKNE